MRNEQLTASIIQQRLSEQLLEAWKRTRDKLGCQTDLEFATRLKLPGTYNQWLTHRRPWPPPAVSALCEAAQMELPELLTRWPLSARLMHIAAEAARLACEFPEEAPEGDRLRRIGIDLRAIHDDHCRTPGRPARPNP